MNSMIYAQWASGTEKKFTVEAKVLLGKLSVLQLLIDDIEKDATIVKRRSRK